MIEYATEQEAKAARRERIANGADPVAINIVHRITWDYSRPLNPRCVPSGGWTLTPIYMGSPWERVRIPDRESVKPYRGTYSDEVVGF